MQFSISNINMTYKKKTVLTDVSFSFGQGESIGILGENGTGKSTLLSILSGQFLPNSGSFMMDGVDLLKNDKLRQNTVAFVPQGTPLIEELSARDNLRLWYSKEAMLSSIDSGFLGMLGIGSFIDVPVHKMSGGMKKRLAIGCAIHANPKVLLLDEPTASLDIICKERIYTYFDYFKRSGGTILLVTHDEREISLMDRCFVLKNTKFYPYTYDGNMLNLAKNLRNE